MKYYTIYQTTNLINNKIYVGLHATDNINDSYLGSGIFLKKAIKKYGYTNFKKEILYVFDNKTDMIKKEKEIVNESFITRKDTYNMSKGGYGLSTLSESKRLETIAKIRKSNLERDHTESSKQRLQTMLNDDPDIFKKIAIKSAQKQKDSYLNGYINPNQNLSDLLIYNQHNEIVFRIKRIDLSDLCIKHDLPERVLIKSIHNGLPIYLKQAPRKEAYLKYKGWYALYENDKLY
jgi:hypothetical protein